MAMTNCMSGVLMYYHLDPRFVHDPSANFSITMREDELYLEHQKLVEAALSMSDTILTKRPELAQHIPHDRELDWKCRSCPYSMECKDMRTAANAFKPGLP
jgi:hypothetical protein